MHRTRRPLRSSAAVTRRSARTGPGRPSARRGEAAILAAGTLLAALLVAAPSAHGAPDTGLQLAAADPTQPAARSAGVPAGGLDLSLPAAAPAAPAASAEPRAARLWDGTVELDDNTRLHGVYRLQIDLYSDDMRPRGGGAPR